MELRSNGPLPPRTAAKTTHIVKLRWANVHFQQEGSKRAPRRPKSAPRDPKTVQDRSKMSYDGLKTVQGGPETAQEVLKRTPERASGGKKH